MKDATIAKLRLILTSFAEEQRPKMTRWSATALRQGYPFHRLLFTDQALLASRLERSVVTTMGSKLFPALAKAVAEDNYNDVHTEYDFQGTLNDAACNMVEQIVTELREARRGRTGAREPNHQHEMEEILGSPGGGPSERTVTADLFVGDFTGGPLFIELKTPLPNLDVAAESKRKILYYLAIQARREIRASAYHGLTYNPYGSRAAYKHGFTKRIMDMQGQVLIGSELWDYLGGPGTFTEVIGLIDEISKDFQLSDAPPNLL